MTLLDKCPRCGNDLVVKQVEKILRGGVNFATLTVHAEVCLRCGERLYSAETVKLFEQIRHKLATEDVEEFEPLGQSFKAPV